MRILLFTICFSLASLASFAQNRGFRQLERKNFDKAEKYFSHAIAQDSADAPAYYGLSQLYVADGFLNYHPDTAYYFIKQALQAWPLNDKEQQMDWKKELLDSLHYQQWKMHLDTMAFATARNLDTEFAYNIFLKKHPTAPQHEEAVERRNALAYQKAVEQNTPEAFQAFYKKYPDAEQVKKAKQFFETRLYESETADQKLSSYQRFVRLYPHSAYVSQALHHIFQWMTADGSLKNYLQFVHQYPEANDVSLAIHTLFFLDPEASALDYDLEGKEQRSYEQLYREYHSLYFPFAEDQQLGLRNEKGQLIFQAQWDSLSTEAQCMGVPAFYFLGKKKGIWELYNKEGDALWDGAPAGVRIVAKGFAILSLAGHQEAMVHLTGKVKPIIGDSCVVMPQGFLAVLKDRNYTFYTLSGVPLQLPTVQDFKWEGSFLGLEQNGKWAVTNKQELAQALFHKVPLSFLYDNLELMGHYLHVISGNYEGLLNENLQNALPLDLYHISAVNHGWLLNREKQYQWLDANFSPTLEGAFEEVKIQKDWLAIQKGKQWSVHPIGTAVFPEFQWDSLLVINPHVVYVEHQGKRYLKFAQGNLVKVSEASRFQVLVNAAHNFKPLGVAVQNQEQYVRLYNNQGDEIFDGDKAEPQALNDDFIKIRAKGHVGVVDTMGKVLLEPVYDGISLQGEDLLSTLKNRKFGAYDIVRGESIAPSYRAQIKKYLSDTLFIANKEGKWGLIDKNDQVVMAFETQHIIPWNARMAFVTLENGDKALYDFQQQDTLARRIRRLYLNQKSGYAYVRTDEGMGLLNKKGDWVIPPVYNDIVALGPGEGALWMAEKKISEADYYVAIYYNAKGEIVFRKGYAPKEYDRIYCDY